MPLAEALRRCPDAVFLPSDRPAYDAASAQVMATLRSFPVVVEVWGWDEAFVGVPRPTTPRRWPARSRPAVLERTGLHCAVGIGETTLQAKTATGFAKPGGVARLTRRDVDPDDGRPAGDRDLGHRRADRRAASPSSASAPSRSSPAPTTTRWPRAFGPRIGPSLRILGLGGDDRPLVDEPWVAKSRSKEETFERDLRGRADDRRARSPASPREVTVGGRRRRPPHHPRRGQGPLRHVLHPLDGSCKLPARRPTADVVAAAATVLARFAAGGFDLDRPIRLLGVRVVLEEPTR